MVGAWSSRARATRSPTRRVSSSSCATTSASSARRSGSGIASWRARTSRLVRRLVRGVRSSWLASATSRRCASRDVSSAESISLKLLASRASSSRPRTSIDAPRSWVRATCSAAPARRSTGRSAARAISSPISAASSTPPAEINVRSRRSDERVSSTSVSGRATCSATPLSTIAVATRRWRPPTCASRKRMASPTWPAAARRSPESTGRATGSFAGLATAPLSPTTWRYWRDPRNGSSGIGWRT